MSRKYAVIATILWFATTSRAFALGLGEIEVQSALNDPFQAVITLTSATDDELEELKVSIASQQSFRQADIPRPLILDSFRFKTERTSAGKPVIRISTRDSIHEPFLEFLVEVVWLKGRMVRQYTVLIDPPYTMPATPPAPPTPVTRAPAPAVAAPAPAPAVSTPAAAPVPVQAAPVARTPATDNYGPIRRNETLWTIAKRLRPDSGISMEQMMLALQRANPDAFINNNINNLKAGAVLAVPDREEILAMSASDASREAGRQHSEWKSARAGDKAEAAKPETTAGSATVVTETRLQLVAPEADAVEAASAAAGTPGDDVQPAAAGSNELEQQLAMATEAAEAGRAQSGELQTRVTELEDQVADMQRLLELKDAQLASMQNRQAGAADTLQSVDDAAATEEPLAAAAIDAAPESQDDAGTEPDTEAAVIEEPNGLVDRLLDNPVLTALGVIVAMVLGGFLWASTRQRKHSDLFSDEPTMANRLSESRQEPGPVFETRYDFKEEPASLVTDEIGPLEADAEGDPLTEADVFIAYGRVQQAEDVIQGALRKSPEDRELKFKLLEIYHAAGNAAAFDTHAEGFRRTIDADDPVWEQIAVMGHQLSPDNPAYRPDSATDTSPDADVDFDMDLSGMDDETHAGDATVDEDLGLDYADTGVSGNGLPESIEFSLDEQDLTTDSAVAVEDETEGMLDSSDEVSTKLDLARAYVDMGDPDSARNILEEVLEEGNDDQRKEAENLFSQVS
jgi:pilus assembly protein FimV